MCICVHMCVHLYVCWRMWVCAHVKAKEQSLMLLLRQCVYSF